MLALGPHTSHALLLPLRGRSTAKGGIEAKCNFAIRCKARVSVCVGGEEGGRGEQ